MSAVMQALYEGRRADAETAAVDGELDIFAEPTTTGSVRTYDRIPDVAAHRSCQRAVQPPSIVRIWPVM